MAMSRQIAPEQEEQGEVGDRSTVCGVVDYFSLL